MNVKWKKRPTLIKLKPKLNRQIERKKKNIQNTDKQKKIKNSNPKKVNIVNQM